MSDPARQVRELLYGQLLSRALQAFAVLGVADELGDVVKSLDVLAERVGARPEPLRRLLRALAAFEVLVEPEPDHFGLAVLGHALRSDAPGSALPTALLATGEVGQAWDQLLETVRSGRPGFERAFGTSFFGYLELKPGLRTMFDRSQESGLRAELPDILRAVDLADGTVVDVGGGDGALLAGVLSAAPGLRGVLVDRQDAVAAARRRFEAADMAHRCEARIGDFFGPWPEGAEIYLLRHVLHDWEDERCAALLRGGRRVMAPGSRLLVVEFAHARRGESGPDARTAALMDLYMLSLFDGGRERTIAELVGLLDAAGLMVDSIAPLPTGAVVINARKG
ncbi:methyltransferase [Saccharopolyspora spinosa]|uniref:methyltransferase n=1 Tax=Saccharopolyspora spinosa TaxID=60894 RepID=UPI0002FEECB0|nr:methyltransferase [Saccharopolyspora spinosa]